MTLNTVLVAIGLGINQIVGEAARVTPAAAIDGISNGMTSNYV